MLLSLFWNRLWLWTLFPPFNCFRHVSDLLDCNLQQEISRSHGLTQLQNLSLIAMKILKVFQMVKWGCWFLLCIWILVVSFFFCRSIRDLFLLIMDTSSTDVLSLNGFEGASLSSIASGRVANHGDYNNVNMQDSSFTDQMQQAGDLSGNSTHGPVSNFTKQSNIQVLNSDYVDSLSKSDGLSNEVKKPVFLDEITSVDENAGKEEGLLDICGTIPGNCLPCLASAVPSVEKRRSLSSSSPSARKKGALKPPFKWKEGNSSNTLCKFCICPLLQLQHYFGGKRK